MYQSGRPKSNTSGVKSAFTGRRVFAAVVALVLMVVLGRRFVPMLPEFMQWVDGLGLWAPVFYVAGYALAPVLLVPGSLLTLAGGALFGLGPGTLYAFIGATVGSCSAFLVSRYLAREQVARRIGRNPRLLAIDRAVGKEGRRIVFLLRLSPLLPFNLLNYFLGLTRVRFVDYALASVGMLPITLLMVYYGKLAGDVAALAGGAAAPQGASHWAFKLLGLLVTVAGITLATRAARRALESATRAADTTEAPQSAAGESP